MKSDAEVMEHIRGGAVVHWERGAVLHEMPITFPVSRGGPIYHGTVASCVRECMARMLRPMTMYSMSFDNGVIEGLGGGLIMQQVIVELAKRDDYPGDEEHPIGFEQMLADEWAVDRRDIYERGIYHDSVVTAAQPIRPEKALARLNVSKAGLVDLLKSGRLGRPGRLGHGRVAWRLDEVEALVSPRDWGK